MTLIDGVRYSREATRISRRELREQLNMQMAPWMKESDQRRLWRELQDEAEGETKKPGILTPERREEYIRNAKALLEKSNAV